MRILKSNKSLLVAAALILFISALYAAGESKKQGDEFCVSCHLPSGIVLHGDKNKTMKAHPPESLAGVHYNPKDIAKRQGCYDCHKGKDLGGKAYVFSREISNTLKYFFGTFNEPEKARSEIADEYCLSCHAFKSGSGLKNRFHFYTAHMGFKEVNCAGCHTFHTARQSDGWLMDKKRVVAKCAMCHKNAATSPFVTEILGREGEERL